MNEAFQNALKLIPQEVPPIWFMRQAGRYQKSYRVLREKYSFLQICKTPELSAAAALSPIKESDFDVAILFSDILFPLEPLGLDFPESAPVIEHHIRTSLDLERIVMSDFSFQAEALKETRRLLPQNKSLIGFVGGPFTLFCFAVSSQRNELEIEGKLPLFAEFVRIIVPIIQEQIKLQLEAGAELIVIFDSFADRLKEHDRYLTVLEDLLRDFHEKIIYFSKSTHYVKLPIALDSSKDLVSYLSSPHRLVQGNFDEKLLLLPTKELKEALLSYLAPIRELPLENRVGWIMSLGHGVLKDTPEENVRLVVEIVREFFSKV